MPRSTYRPYQERVKIGLGDGFNYWNFLVAGLKPSLLSAVRERRRLLVSVVVGDAHVVTLERRDRARIPAASALEVAHRARHRSDILWRLVHQMHHAPERIDTSAGFFAHPFEFVWLGVTSGAVTALLGVSPGAAALGTFLSFALNVFVHTNIRTPRWLGLVISRPEMHAVHHEAGVHAFNYAFCSLYDRAFGTYRNPETFHGENGLSHDAWKKIGTLLFASDVTRVGLGTVSTNVTFSSPPLAAHRRWLRRAAANLAHAQLAR